MFTPRLDRAEAITLLSVKGAVRPFFQPIVDMAQPLPSTEHEALARMSRGDIIFNPGEFLPFFESTAHQKVLDELVLVGAIEQIAEWYTQTGAYTRVHVNASEWVLESTDYVPLITKTLEQHRLPRHVITIEILETCHHFWRNPKILKTLDDLSEARIGVAFDDFPSWRDPKEMLDWIHRQGIGKFRALKLDRPLIQRACNSSGSDGIAAINEVLEYVDFAEAHHMKIIAEGVETPREVFHMRDLGAHCLQGYALGKPISGESVRHTKHEYAIYAETDDILMSAL
jgi:diguanylate cyclase